MRTKRMEEELMIIDYFLHKKNITKDYRLYLRSEREKIQRNIDVIRKQNKKYEKRVS